jgi:AhpD family alkylhydroperoxidase
MLRQRLPPFCGSRVVLTLFMSYTYVGMGPDRAIGGDARIPAGGLVWSVAAAAGNKLQAAWSTASTAANSSIHQRQRGIVMSERVNIGKAAPELYKAVAGLDKLSAEAAAAAGLAKGFVHLLRLRASQLNQCAFCVKLHTSDALASGESIDRVSVLPAWRETEYFSDKERASLELMEAITFISDGQVPDGVYERAAARLSKEEIAAVEWLGVVINAWNRIAISSRYPVRP